MKAPRFAAITISLNTEAFRSIRPEVRDHKIAYLLSRLLCGEEVAESEFEHYGLKVTIME